MVCCAFSSNLVLVVPFKVSHCSNYKARQWPREEQVAGVDRAAPKTRVRFGAFELDLRSGELCRVPAAVNGKGGAVLTKQAFLILQMLIEREGGIVTREEIRQRLWSNDVVVEFDHSINVAIRKLRKTLGDSAAKPTHIGTLARRGYRLMVPVEWPEFASALSVPASTLPGPKSNSAVA